MSQEHPTRDAADRAPLQFTTRSLFMAIAVCALVLVVFDQAGAVWGAVTLWFLILVAAHVGANVRGSRESRRPSIATEWENLDRDRPPSCASSTVERVPPTRLRSSTGPGRVLTAVIASGAVLGLILGTLTLALVTRADASGILLGGLSAGALGGILGFAAGSCAIVAGRAFQEAARDSRADSTPGFPSARSS